MRYRQLVTNHLARPRSNEVRERTSVFLSKCEASLIPLEPSIHHGRTHGANLLSCYSKISGGFSSGSNSIKTTVPGGVHRRSSYSCLLMEHTAPHRCVRAFNFWKGPKTRKTSEIWGSSIVQMNVDLGETPTTVPKEEDMSSSSGDDSHSSTFKPKNHARAHPGINQF